MSEPKTQEPSMEEILASIRRIISEEGGGQPEGGPAAEQPAATAPPVPAKDEVLELTEVVEEDGSVKTLVAEAAAPEAPAPEPEPPRAMAAAASPGSGEGALVGEPIATQSADTLSQLVSMLARQEGGRRDIPLGASDLTIEELVRDMLRPLLREWLDQHLGGLVERLVRREIDKLVRRAEGR